ncbi:MAG: HRDC domain-containing protein, partial [Planctomycetales bacterium]|nr:HRDC domain-containing protein [Planctomycetales bacterium]
EEYLFCMRAVGQRPHGLIDLQLAAGLIGVEYPASYGNLVSRLLGRSLPKGETRTDWRRRPLTQRQIDYALQDVVHLEAMRDAIFQRLEKLGRLQWLEDEMLAWQASLDESVSRRRWRRVSGISGLSARSLAIVRELWQWRETVAQDRNIPSRRVLRDDLIVEMARRQTADPNRIRAVRGMNFRDVQRRIDDIAAAVQTALNLPDDELPRGQRRDLPSQLTVLGQFLTTAIASVCRRAEVAPSLVCSVQDVRDFVAWELNINRSPDDDPPALAIGWRREVVGDLIDDMLSGRVAIRIDDPLSDHPLVMDRLTGDA